MIVIIEAFIVWPDPCLLPLSRLYLQWLAFSSASQAEHREVAWYTVLAKHSAIQSPKVVSECRSDSSHDRLQYLLHLVTQIAAHWCRAFSRVLIVTEMMTSPWATVADWRGASAQQMKALVCAAATFHSTPGFSGSALSTGPGGFMGPVKGFSGLDKIFSLLKLVVLCTCSSRKIPEVLWQCEPSSTTMSPHLHRLPVCPVRHPSVGFTRQVLRAASCVHQPRGLPSGKSSLSPTQ